MNNTGRLVLGVIAGVTIWSLLWIAGTGAAQAAFPDVLDPAQRLEHVGALLGYIAYSVVLSLLSGYVAAAAAAAGGARAAMRAAWIVAVILLGLGIFFEVDRGGDPARVGDLLRGLVLGDAPRLVSPGLPGPAGPGHGLRREAEGGVSRVSGGPLRLEPWPASGRALF
jgi:hypothetical protein